MTIDSSLASAGTPAPPPPLVLVANDQEWSARTLESVLGQAGFAVVRAYTGRQAVDVARRTHPDAVILDIGMPDIGGIEVCQLLRSEVGLSQSTPIVMTTSGPASRALRLDALRAGAWELLSEPIDSEALLLKMGAFVQSKREIDRVRDSAVIDPVTGLYNVRGLARRAKEIGADAARRHAALACVVVSPSNEIPESTLTDHENVSRVVAYLSEICREATRTSDAVGHLGHLEFAIIAPASDMAGALRIVERIQAAVNTRPLMIAGEYRQLRVRAGYSAVADFAEATVDAVEMMLRAATALKHARPAEGKELTVAAFEDVAVRTVK
ncbi:MAG TPA: response regulator [Gemmatimonadaceae bacterium]|nr:response regulator [Gemmatimonadaceae bacterium]